MSSERHAKNVIVERRRCIKQWKGKCEQIGSYWSEEAPFGNPGLVRQQQVNRKLHHLQRCTSRL